MNNVSLHVDMLAGSGIEECCQDALRLAQQLHIMITFDFNGAYMVAVSSDDEEDLVSCYHSHIKRNEE